MEEAHMVYSDYQANTAAQDGFELENRNAKKKNYTKNKLSRLFKRT